jgi:hypothetical protein
MADPADTSLLSRAQLPTNAYNFSSAIIANPAAASASSASSSVADSRPRLVTDALSAA